MDKKEFIESGILELYVYGTLSDEDIKLVQSMSKEHPDVEKEIIEIEKAAIGLSRQVAPYLSISNYEKIRGKVFNENGVVSINRRSNLSQYLGWAAAAVFILGFGLQFLKLQDSEALINNLNDEKSTLQKSVVNLEFDKQEAESVLAIVRDNNTISVPLAGQEVSPNSYAKAYYNKETKQVHIDAAGLPKPPEGKVYQIWALKLNPLTPKSLGLLKDFTAANTKVFKMDSADGAEAFGITLVPAGGSESPTLEQLYTLGKV